MHNAIKAACLPLLVLLAAPAALAAEKGETWHAMSTTALAITGDIVVFSDHLVFADKQRISFTPVGNTPVGKPGRSSGIFRLDPPATPTLLNGNRLCGPKAVQYVAFSKPDGKTLSLSVFDRKAAPSSADDQPCGVFNYVR